MRAEWVHVFHMAKMLQLRNVSDELHRTLKARAAMEGMSLSDYLIRELRRIAERPSRSELIRRLEARSRTKPDVTPEKAVRAERDRR